MGEEVEATVVPDKQNKESGKNIEKYSADVGKMDEEVEASRVPDQQNDETIGGLEYIKKLINKYNDKIEKRVEAKEIFEEAISDT